MTAPAIPYSAGKPIGPSFSAELAAAGLLGLPFSWDANGDFLFDGSMTDDQMNAVKAVIAAHSAATPGPPPPPMTIPAANRYAYTVANGFSQQLPDNANQV